MNLPGGSERKVRRNDRLRIEAKTYNDLIDMLKAWKRDKHSVGSPSSTFEVTPSCTVLVKNRTDDDVAEAQVLRISDVAYNPANSKRQFNIRPMFLGRTPNDSKNSFVITDMPIEDGKVGIGIIKGIAVCKVKINSASHDWAKPVDGELYLESAESGPARILWYGVVTDSVLSGDSGEIEEADPEDVYTAVVDLIGSNTMPEWCADGWTFPVDEVPITQPGYPVNGLAMVKQWPIPHDGSSEATAFAEAVGGSRETLVLDNVTDDPLYTTLCIDKPGDYEIIAGLTVYQRWAYGYQQFLSFNTMGWLVFIDGEGNEIGGGSNNIVDSIGEGAAFTDPIKIVSGQVAKIGFTDSGALLVNPDSGNDDSPRLGMVTGDVYHRGVSGYDLQYSGDINAGPLGTEGDYNQWMGSNSILRRLIVREDDLPVRLAWKIRTVWGYNRAPSANGVSSQLCDIYINFGVGGSYIRKKQMNAVECICEEQDSGGSGESGESTPQDAAVGCCEVALASHPNLVDDADDTAVFTWDAVDGRYEGTIDGHTVNLTCTGEGEDGVWFYSVVGVGSGIATSACSPFSLTFTNGTIGSHTIVIEE